MTKKFFKTYYSIPDKRDRLEVVFDRGYRNIEVILNGKSVATFAGANELIESREINTPEGQLIHLRFLKDSVEFEVFLDGIQIDNSATSPQKVMASLKTPVYISMSWYIIVLTFAYFLDSYLTALAIRNPMKLLTDIPTIYLLTSSLVVLIVMIVALVWLNRGNTFLYLTALIVFSADLLFGTIYQLYAFLGNGISFNFLMLLALVFPLVFKSFAIRSFISGYKKYVQFVYMRNLHKTKINDQIVDI